MKLITCLLIIFTFLSCDTDTISTTAPEKDPEIYNGPYRIKSVRKVFQDGKEEISNFEYDEHNKLISFTTENANGIEITNFNYVNDLLNSIINNDYEKEIKFNSQNQAISITESNKQNIHKRNKFDFVYNNKGLLQTFKYSDNGDTGIKQYNYNQYNKVTLSKDSLYGEYRVIKVDGSLSDLIPFHILKTEKNKYNSKNILEYTLHSIKDDQANIDYPDYGYTSYTTEGDLIIQTKNEIEYTISNYEFNNQGQLASMVKKDLSGKLLKEVKYKYDGNNLVEISNNKIITYFSYDKGKSNNKEIFDLQQMCSKGYCPSISLPENKFMNLPF
jgi:hypothetical protein